MKNMAWLKNKLALRDKESVPLRTRVELLSSFPDMVSYLDIN